MTKTVKHVFLLNNILPDITLQFKSGFLFLCVLFICAQFFSMFEITDETILYFNKFMVCVNLFSRAEVLVESGTKSL